MANPSSTGIDKWVLGIRNRMANDPGRQDLEDHILCNGFLFLQEYLEEIVNGPKYEPIIELTKTPGRRKDIPKRDKVESPAKVKRFLNSPEKENIEISTDKAVYKSMPSFQTLLGKPERGIDVELSNTLNFNEHLNLLPKPEIHNFGSNVDDQEERLVEILVTPPSTSSKKPDSKVSPVTNRTVKFILDSAPIDDKNNGGALSMIMEGDERETSQAVVSPRKGLIIGDREISYQIPKDPSDPDGPMATITVPYSEEDRSFDDSEPTSTISSFPIDPYARDYETHELPKIVPVASSPPPVEGKPPMQVPAPNLTRKASVPVFPNLPPPSPMRKSLRESVNTAHGGAVKPTGNGTRSSWLQKAKDVTAKHGGVKRKSGEMLEDSVGGADWTNRLVKVARTDDDSAQPVLTEKLQPIPVIQPFRPVAKPRDPVAQVQHLHTRVPSNEDSEGMMDVLKRTVEGLGHRVGKGLGGKSLGGAAASAAAAEAKAAAEARLAQREAKGSDGVRQPKQSVSELIGVYEFGSSNDHGSAESIYKPPNPPSPIAPRLLLDRASVSSDFPPVAPIRLVSQNSIPQFQVQRPPLKEFNSQPHSQNTSQPSTQSTYVSNLFDDNPTWSQSSFVTEYASAQALSQSLDQAYSQQTHAQYEDGVIDSQGAQRTQHSQEHKTVRALDHVFTDEEPDGVVDEEEMVTGQNAVSYVNERPDESDDDHDDGITPQSSQEKPQGFVAQASSIISKVIGSTTLKRTKPEPVKSIQLAAVAAKKQQEEAEKKAARLREMEKRRAAIASKKTEQDSTEKFKIQKRDREDDTTKTVPKKTEDDTTKKRKVVVEIEKKPVTTKKPPSKDKVSSTPANNGLVRMLSKPALSSQAQLAPPSLVKSTKQVAPVPVAGPSSHSKLISGQSQMELKAPPLPIPATKPQALHGKSNMKEAVYEDMRQPSETLQSQMHARVQAQISQAKQQQERQEPLIASESIELPDINSEYSNSDDEDRPRTFDPPDWAQSPVLAQALQSQSHLNPDDIFGPVKPLRMEEIFKKNTSRFRARTSSANWAGTDELTKEEEKAYAKRMGYIQR